MNDVSLINVSISIPLPLSLNSYKNFFFFLKTHDDSETAIDLGKTPNFKMGNKKYLMMALAGVAHLSVAPCTERSLVGFRPEHIPGCWFTSSGRRCPHEQSVYEKVMGIIASATSNECEMPEQRDYNSFECMEQLYLTLLKMT